MRTRHGSVVLGTLNVGLGQGVVGVHHARSSLGLGLGIGLVAFGLGRRLELGGEVGDRGLQPLLVHRAGLDHCRHQAGVAGLDPFQQLSLKAGNVFDGDGVEVSPGTGVKRHHLLLHRHGRLDPLLEQLG